ncbi:MAG: AI-2E family transporter [Solirubrobacterales bacterium]|nr:AI-2E family transporter [Solirubrobacterales bacterium]
MAEPKVTPTAIYRAVLLAFGLVVAGLIFEQLATLVLAVLIVVIIALPLAAFATLLERFHVPRPVGVLLGLAIAIGALALLVFAIIPVFTHEINRFANSLPGIVDSLRHKLGRLTGNSPTKTGQQIQQFINGYTHQPSKLLGPIASIGTSVAAALAAVVVVLLTAVFTAIQPEPLVKGTVRIVPVDRRSQAMHILERLGTAYLGWLRGLIVGMVILGVLTYLGLRIVGLQFAAFFAILTAIAMIVPYFGALVSSVPPILYALTISPGKAVIVAAIYILAHQVESNMIQPLVMARAVKLHPAVVAVGVVAIDRLFGFIGLIVAVPILATIRILIQEVWIFPMESRNLTLAKPGAVAAEPAPLAGRGPNGLV